MANFLPPYMRINEENNEMIYLHTLNHVQDADIFDNEDGEIRNLRNGEFEYVEDDNNFINPFIDVESNGDGNKPSEKLHKKIIRNASVFLVTVFLVASSTFLLIRSFMS